MRYEMRRHMTEKEELGSMVGIKGIPQSRQAMEIGVPL